MSTSLTSARHELATTAQADLDRLNAKLEGIVSEVPASATTAPQQHGQGQKPDDDQEDSEDEDPTELFHRDIGTQTSPAAAPSSRRSSNSDTSSLANPPVPSSATLVTTHTSRLQTLRTHLTSQLNTNATLQESDDRVKDAIADLTTYLDGLAYASPSYVNSSAYGAYGAGGTAAVKVEDDGIAKVKAEIRGVKGVLLSARTFPGSAVGRGAGAGMRVGGGV